MSSSGHSIDLHLSLQYAMLCWDNFICQFWEIPWCMICGSQESTKQIAHQQLAIHLDSSINGMTIVYHTYWGEVHQSTPLLHTCYGNAMWCHHNMQCCVETPVTWDHWWLQYVAKLEGGLASVCAAELPSEPIGRLSHGLWITLHVVSVQMELREKCP